MVKYMNKKAVLSLLLTGSIALSMSGCGGKIVKNDFLSLPAINQEQSSDEFETVEATIEDHFTHIVTPEATKCVGVSKVLGTHANEGKTDEYDVMISQGIFHSEVHQDKVYTIEEANSDSLYLATVEIVDGMVDGINVCVDLKNYNNDDLALMYEKFSPESIDYIKNNSLSSMEKDIIRKKYMNAISSSDYVTTANNFIDLINNGNSICVDKEGNTVTVETNKHSKGLN